MQTPGTRQMPTPLAPAAPQSRRHTCIGHEDIRRARVLPLVCCCKLAHRLQAGQVQLGAHLHVRTRVLLPVAQQRDEVASSVGEQGRAVRG